MVFKFFLGSGAREQAVMYACWSDIDWEAGSCKKYGGRWFLSNLTSPYVPVTIWIYCIPELLPVRTQVFLSSLSSDRKQRRNEFVRVFVGADVLPPTGPFAYARRSSFQLAVGFFAAADRSKHISAQRGLVCSIAMVSARFLLRADCRVFLGSRSLVPLALGEELLLAKRVAYLAEAEDLWR